MEDFQAEDTEIKQAVQSCLVYMVVYVFLFECCCIYQFISDYIIHV